MKHLLPLLAVLMIIASCKKENTDDPAGNWSNSVFIINEGPFPTGTGTISALNRETLEITNDLFGAANGRELGNIVQSLTVFDDRAFIMVNNANKIEVVNLEDFKSIATIEDIPLPRYFVALDENKGYVSCWDSTVKVIDLNDYSITASIRAGTGPEDMLITGNALWVLNGGGYNLDSTVTVINTSTDMVVETLHIGHRPLGIQQDVNGDLWILCGGRGYNGWPAPDDTPGRLVSIKPATLSIEKEFIFPDTENHPENLVINKEKNTLFYNYPTRIFAFPINGTALNEHAAITVDQSIYGMGYDDEISMIYVTYPLDFTQTGWIARFREQDGAEVDSYQVGVAPNGFWFN